MKSHISNKGNPNFDAKMGDTPGDVGRVRILQAVKLRISLEIQI